MEDGKRKNESFKAKDSMKNQGRRLPPKNIDQYFHYILFDEKHAGAQSCKTKPKRENSQ